MKKISYLLFIGIIAFGSCTKQDPIEVNITDSSSSNSTNPLINTQLTGHWKQTNVTNLNSNNSWDNGQIDLHFFADGTWHINCVGSVNVSGTIATGDSYGTYKIHSNNYINIGNSVFIYSINNGVINFSSVPGLDYLWTISASGPTQTTFTTDYIASNSQYTEINNLVKQ